MTKDEIGYAVSFAMIGTLICGIWFATGYLMGFDDAAHEFDRGFKVGVESAAKAIMDDPDEADGK